MRKIDKIFQCGETLQADDLNEMIDQINEIIEYVSTHSGSRPDPDDPDIPDNPVVEETVKSFNTIIQEFNDTGYYSPSIQSTGSTSQLYGYLNSMYTRAKEEYEGNSELFKSSTYSNLEILNYHGGVDKYELDGTAENAMLYWIIAMCLSELIPNNAYYNNQTKLFKFAYDIGEESGYGREFRLYGGYTPKGDPIICRLVASVIYAKYRRNYKNYIPSFRSKLGGNTIPVSSTGETNVWANALQLIENNNPKGNHPTNYGYTINLDDIFPAAAGPYLSEYSTRANNPKDQQGEDKDEFDETVGGEFELNYLVDKNIYNTAVSNYNIRTKNNFSRSVQAVADDCEDMAQILGNITYYNYYNSSDPTDSFYKVSNGNNYFKGTFNADVIGRDLSGYIKTTNFTDLLEYTREAAGRNRLTTLDPQYGRKRPCQGNTEQSTKWISSTNRAKSYLYDRSIDYILGVPGTYWDDTGHRAYKDLDADLNYDSGEGSDGNPARWISANTYPSGHSSEIWAEAMMMIELFPNRYIDIYKAAYAYTVSRTIVRAHWNSDIIFGKLGATTIVPILHAMSNFDTVYNNAVTALNNPPETGPSITINNNTGASAKITGEVYIITSQGMIYGYIENINGVPVNEGHKNSGYNIYTIPAGVSVTAQLYIENPYNIPLGTSLSFDDSVEINSPIRVYGINSQNERNKSTFICSDPDQTTYGNFNYVINLTQGAQHIIDIAYASDFLTSPRLSGYKGTTFNQPTLYIKENNVIYVSVDGDSTYSKYPYWSQLQAQLKYRFEQSTDTNYATLNLNGSVVLNNITTGDGVRVGVYTEQNSMFNIIDSHFYISISEGTQNPFNVIIDNQLGETTYITGEIYFFVNDGNNSVGTVYSYTQENILVDSTGDSMNRCKIELPQGENTFSIVKFETPPGTDYRNGIQIRNNVDSGVTEYGVRVYGYGKSGSGVKYNNTNNSDHLKYAFKARIDKTSFSYANTTYRITLYDKGIQYDDVWVNDNEDSSNNITVSQSGIVVNKSGGTSVLNVTSTSSWTATSNCPAWCTVSKSGNNLIVVTGANSSGIVRQARISITNGYKTVIVTVNQSGESSVPYHGEKFIDISYISTELETNTYDEPGTVYYNLDDPTTLPKITIGYYPTAPNYTVQFSSSNPTVASVSNTGAVSPLEIGTTVIRAQLTCNDSEYTVKNTEGFGAGITQYILIVVSNSTPSNKHNIDIAYSDNWISPKKVGVEDTSFTQPILYIKENNIIYSQNDYPYWNQLKPYLRYRLEDDDIGYALINQGTGVIDLYKLTNNHPTSGDHVGDGITCYTYIMENDQFTTSDAHFYLKIIEQQGQDIELYAIINNQTGSKAYITGEIQYFVHGSGNNIDTIVYTCSEENVSNDIPGIDSVVGDGEAENITLIELQPGENRLHFVYTEYYGGASIPSGTVTFRDNTIVNKKGVNVTEHGVRVYAHGITEHERCAFNATISESVYQENNVEYHITITQGSDYDLMYSPSGARPDNNITLSKSSISSSSSGGTFVVTIASNNQCTATNNSAWCTTSISGTTLTISISANSGPSSRTATITITNGSDTKTITVTQSGSGNSDNPQYTVGLLSDIHFHTLADDGTRSITTDNNGNSTTNGDQNSLYDKDLTYLIQHDFSNVDFISSPGDIATYNINDFIHFTKTYKKAYTGSETGSNFKPFYCSTGNHDHGLIYCNNNGRVQSGGVDIGTYGNRWNTLSFGNTNYPCPGQLATGEKTSFGSKGSYFVNKNGDIYVYLMVDYGYENEDGWASQVQPHNQLSSANEHVQYMMGKCGKTSIFDANSPERYFNFQYYNPYDLHYLGELVLKNLVKRIFVFSHHFFTNKAGTNGNYHPGGSTNLMGLTFHYLNWLNDNYTNVIWFTGHSHVSWREILNVLHWTNSKFGGNIPTTSTYSNRISDNGTWDIKEGNSSRHYYSGMWNIKTYQEDQNGSTLGNEVYYRTTSSGTGGWNIHLPSMSRPVLSGDSLQSSCEAGIMKVYSNKVVIQKLGYITNNGIDYTEETLPDDNILTININQDSSNVVVPNIVESTPTGDGIILNITNTLNVEARFSGKVILNVGKNTNSWDNVQNATQVEANMISDGTDTHTNHISIPAGGSYTTRLMQTSKVYNGDSYQDGVKIQLGSPSYSELIDGTWNILGVQNPNNSSMPIYLYSAYEYGSVAPDDSDHARNVAHSGATMYIISIPDSTSIQNGKTFNVNIVGTITDQYNRSMTLAPDNSGYYMISSVQQ